MSEQRTITVNTLGEMKQQGRKISVLTAYDASFAAIMDACGIDCILVGDSLGHVIQGQSTTLPVSVDDVVYHTRAVARAVSRPLLIADMPFLSYCDQQTAVATAHRLIAEGGARMVKLEGGSPQHAEIVANLYNQGIAVCGHLGLTPQWVHRFGGYRVQGRRSEDAERMMEEAVRLEQAGLQLLVLEGIPSALAQAISQRLTIPTIGIGAGVHSDGQVLVLHDMLGMNPRPAKFVRDFLGLGGSIQGAISAYIEAVRNGTYPNVDETYSG